jgi:hypothetical protein
MKKERFKGLVVPKPTWSNLAEVKAEAQMALLFGGLALLLSLVFFSHNITGYSVFNSLNQTSSDWIGYTCLAVFMGCMAYWYIKLRPQLVYDHYNLGKSRTKKRI